MKVSGQSFPGGHNTRHSERCWAFGRHTEHPDVAGAQRARPEERNAKDIRGAEITRSLESRDEERGLPVKKGKAKTLARQQAKLTCTESREGCGLQD